MAKVKLNALLDRDDMGSCCTADPRERRTECDGKAVYVDGSDLFITSGGGGILKDSNRRATATAGTHLGGIHEQF